MTRGKHQQEKSVDRIATEIRQELRGIIRKYSELREPLRRFERDVMKSLGDTCWYLVTGRQAIRQIDGLKMRVGSVCFPDESIQDEVIHFAQAVWQLKDRLRQYKRATQVELDPESFARQHTNLMVCADLANYKKHGGHENRSGLNPQLGLVEFDTSQSGLVEFCYEGAMKRGQLAVTERKPIPYRVDIIINDGPVVLGDAVRVIYDAFRSWLPLLQQLGVLKGDNPESKALLKLLQ